ncbi:hypothetical protein ACHQM5_012946 [Ranunculus cassubicifolius]
MDRLSYLHPPLRAHIVSFISTKEAIKLAILSSHWRQVSSSLSKLTFTKHLGDQKAFRDCVDMALATHDETDIQRFDLDALHDDDIVTESDLNRWITILVQHNIRMLKLLVRTSKPTSLPCFLFTCGTLTRLVLAKIKLPVFPPLVRFPKLTYFGLVGVEFGDTSKEILNLSFSATSFPVLGTLHLHTRQQIQSLSISIPSLQHLYLRTRKSPALKLSISTGQEVRLFYEGLPHDISTIDISTESVSSITSAILNTDWDPELLDSSSTSHNASKIMSGLFYAEKLHLLDFFIEFLCWDRSFSWRNRILSISLKKLDLHMFRAKKNHVKMVKFLTGCFPQLQTLKITVVDIPKRLEGLQDTEVHGDDNAMSPHLRRIDIVNLEGMENELELARYFLATATMLEEMNISFSVHTEVDTRKRVELNLMSSPKVSQQVVPRVYHE